MSNTIYLRPVQISDLAIILAWENNEDNWEVSGTIEPYTEEEIADFIVEQQNYKVTGQLRLMICLRETDFPIGAIDLYDINYVTKLAGVGILIEQANNRRKGYATQALQQLKVIAKQEVGLEQLFCLIHQDNLASLRLFEKADFKLIEKNALENTFRFECHLG